MRQEIEYYNLQYKILEYRLRSGAFNQSEWIMLIMKMRINGYGFDADAIVERLRSIINNPMRQQNVEANNLKLERNDIQYGLFSE